MNIEDSWARKAGKFGLQFTFTQNPEAISSLHEKPSIPESRSLSPGRARYRAKLEYPAFRCHAHDPPFPILDDPLAVSPSVLSSGPLPRPRDGYLSQYNLECSLKPGLLAPSRQSSRGFIYIFVENPTHLGVTHKPSLIRCLNPCPRLLFLPGIQF